MLLPALVLLIATPPPQFVYPPTKTVEAADIWFGKTYKDPYRWLEDLKAAPVEQWFKSQAALTAGLLGRIPARDALADERMKLDKPQPARHRAIAVQSRRRLSKQALGGEHVGKRYCRAG